MPKPAHITEVVLADGEAYRFARLPTSAALVARFADAMDDAGNMMEHVAGLDRALRTSLKLAGYGPGEVEEISLLIDLEDREVYRAVTAAVFRRELLAGGPAVDAVDGAVRSGVGDGSS